MLRIALLTIALIYGSGLGWAHAGDSSPQSRSQPADPALDEYNALIAGAKASMMADPSRALKLARDAEAKASELADKGGIPQAVATSLWLQSEALTRTNHVDDARPLIERAMDLVSKTGKKTKLYGDINLSRARLAHLLGKVAIALKSYQAAHDTFAALGEARGEAMSLEGLGSIYDEAHDFPREIEYYERARQIFPDDPAINLSVANNLGEAFKQLGRYDDALEQCERALQISIDLKSSYLEARILTNIAAIDVKKGDLKAAQIATNRAMSLLKPKDEGDWARFIWGVRAQIEYNRGNMAAAANDLRLTFQGLDLTQTTANYRDMHEIAYKVYLAQGDYKDAVAHLDAFKRLDDEGRELASNANLALMSAQFDFANQQLEIEHLKTEQLKRDFSLAQSRATMQKMMLASILLVSLLIIAWIAWNYVSVRRHRNVISRANIKLLNTVAEREEEILLRKKTEAQLRVAKDDAERASHSKSQFLANMSHELRTPLNAIIGFAEIMEGEMMGPMGSPTYKGYSADIVSSGRHLLSILNDILDMARIDAGKIVLDESEFDLCAMSKDVMRLFQEDAKRDQKAIEFECDWPDLLVYADQRLMRQILINLLSNAMKFTKKAGTIRIIAERCFDGGAELIVSDNGIGIPAEKLDHVMEPFGQAADAFSRAQGGVGLGLPIVKSLCELHGGNFRLESKVGVGTSAHVRLPPERVITLLRGKMTAAS